MNCATNTYGMKDLAFPIPALNSGAAPVMGTRGEGVSLGLSEFGLAGFLAWLRLWLACVAEGRLAYKRGSRASQSYRPPSLLPDSARAAVAPRLRLNRQIRRRKARGLPASRQYVGLHHLSARSLTIGQFLERACKVSSNGRVVVYRLVGRKRLCQRREEFVGLLGCSRDFGLKLCAASPWPD